MRLANILILGVFFVPSLLAEPFLSPNDPFIRHEIRLLADEGELTGMQNTWPFGCNAGRDVGVSQQYLWASLKFRERLGRCCHIR